jgi:hypothetical protein
MKTKKFKNKDLYFIVCESVRMRVWKSVENSLMDRASNSKRTFRDLVWLSVLEDVWASVYISIGGFDRTIFRNSIDTTAWNSVYKVAQRNIYVFNKYKKI